VQRLPARNANGEPHDAGVAAAVAALRAGDLVIVPTDTVYGIAADALDAAAVARLFRAKNRPPEKAIALLAASPAQAALVADLSSPVAQRLCASWWPGPLTLVCRAQCPLPEGVGTGDTVGVRVPADPVVQAIARDLGRPLAVSSANRSGDDATATFEMAIRDIGEYAAIGLDGGDCPIGLASTVVDITSGTPVVLRQGSAVIDEKPGDKSPG
jgi:L-threonylcarbamoyladenylate synthase